MTIIKVFNTETYKSIGRNTLYSVSAVMINALSKVIIASIAIHYLGIDGFGVWAIVLAIVSYTRLGIGGSQAAFQKYVAESTATKDYRQVERLLSTGGLAILLISLVFALPIVLLSPELVLLVKIPNKYTTPAAISVSFMALVMVLANVGGVYRAIIMGGHRIDLCKKIEIILVVFEGVLSVVLLIRGFGLYALAATLALGETIRFLIYYYLSSRIVPEIRIGPGHVSWSVINELIRYAGSFHLVSILELLFHSILPISILRLFGAESAGVYAVSTRLVDFAVIFPESLMLPLLSGASFAYSDGSLKRLKIILNESLKYTLTSIFPTLTILAIFGNTIYYGWTGGKNDLFLVGLQLICTAYFFRTIARIFMIMYRTIGKGSHDVIWVLLRLIIVIVYVSLIGNKYNEYFVLLAIVAFSELIGMLIMFSGVYEKIGSPDWRILWKQIYKLFLLSVVMMFVCTLLIKIPIPWYVDERSTAIIQIFAVLFVFVLLIGFFLLKTLSSDEKKFVIDIFLPNNSSTIKH